MYEKTPVMMHVIGSDFRLKMVSDRWLQTLGYSRAEVIGHPVVHFQTPESARRAREEYLPRLQKDGRLENGRLQFICKNGEMLDLELSAIAESDPDGSFRYGLGFLTNITQRRQAERKFRDLVEGSIQGIYIHRQWQLLFVNQSMAGILGYPSVAELLSLKNVREFLPPYELDRLLRIRQARERGEPLSSKHVADYQKRDGTVVRLESVNQVIDWEGGPAIQSTVIDITEQHQAETALHESEQRYRSIFQSTALGIIVSVNGKITEWNSGAEHLFGYRAAEATGQTLKMLVPERYQDAHRSSYEAAVQRGGVSKEGTVHQVAARRRDGTEFPVEFTLSSWRSGGTLYFCAIALDITERKQQEERILYQAHFDSLTRLPNRFLALDRLSQAMIEADRKQTRVAVLFLDLDDFKRINDSLGHETGDKLLVEAAARLQKGLRSNDTIGRLGGDEFIVILGDMTDSTAAGLVAETLLKQFREPFHIDGRKLVLTISVGIAIYPSDGGSPSELLRNADSAMYCAKERGRNTYACFTEEMNNRVTRQLQIEVQMRDALKRGEFRLCYQPQVEVRSGRVTGAEALIRWFCPALGEISPVEFIPVAEHTGLIIPIGRFVLSRAIHQAALWQQHDPGFRIAINLSPSQFRDPELGPFVTTLMQESGISEGSIELEITEGVLMGGHTHTDRLLAEFSEQGISIAMDDFGTGYSSMSYLRRYPFDRLKIDRSFIGDLTDDKGDQELVSAIISMAHGMGLKVTAEGVETESQRRFIDQLHCDFAQGYLYSRPVTDQQIEALLIAACPLPAHTGE